MTERKFGWVKDVYDPAAVYHRPKAVQIPLAVNYLNLCHPVRDQGSVGSCSGFGIGGMAYTVAKAGGFAIDLYSPTWLYNGARYMIGELAEDAGAAPEDVFSWIFYNGLLHEKYWPYNPDKLDMSAPSSLRMSQAIKYPDYQAIRVDNGVDGIISALAEKHCVAIGAPWPKEWMEPTNGHLVIPKPNSIVAGGHEIFLFGYDELKGAFDGQNSWGTDWADKGRCLVPFEYIDWAKQNGGYDTHYIVMTAPPVAPKKKFLCWEY